jgi:hypothetical protein
MQACGRAACGWRCFDERPEPSPPQAVGDVLEGFIGHRISGLDLERLHEASFFRRTDGRSHGGGCGAEVLGLRPGHQPGISHQIGAEDRHKTGRLFNGKHVESSHSRSSSPSDRDRPPGMPSPAFHCGSLAVDP